MMSSREAIEEMNYHNDHRVIARERGPVEGFDEKAMTITHVIEECSCDKCEAKGPPYYAVPAIYIDKPAAVIDWSLSGSYVTDGKDYREFFERREGPLPQYGFQIQPCQDDLSGLNAAKARTEELNAALGFTPDWTPEPHVIVFRACYEVCSTCDGKGSHVNPDIDAGGISGDDPFWEDDIDYDECEYDDDGECLGPSSRYRRGDYDVPCYECHGKRVVPVPRDDNDPADLKLWHDKQHNDYAYERECRAERMMGA